MSFIYEGSGNPDILYESPLTSTPVLGTDIGTPTYDPTGVVFGTSESIALDLTSLSLPASIATEGQFTLFYENTFIGNSDASSGSEGTSQATQYMLSHNNTGTTTAPTGRTFSNVVGRASTQINTADAQQVTSGTTASAGLSELLAYTVSWEGGNSYSVYDNGREIVRSATCTPFSDMWDHAWIGSYRGTGASPIGYKFSRFSLASSPVTLANLGTLMGLGDSYINISTEKYLPGAAAGPYLYDVTLANQLQALTRLNDDAEYTYVNEGVGGEKIAQILARTATALSTHNPTVVLLHAGTNDAKDTVISPNIEADYLSLITLCADHASVEKVIYETIPTIKAMSTFDTPLYVANVSSVNTSIRAAVATYQSSNPDKAQNIRESDIFTAMGGESPSEIPAVSALFAGFQDELNLDLHPTSQGDVVRAASAYAAINKVFGIGGSGDVMADALKRLGFTGALSDMTVQWLESLGATPGSIDDRWKILLDDASVPVGGMNERKIQYYATETGTTPALANKSVNELKRDFWLAQ